jgi:hypothetical protein
MRGHDVFPPDPFGDPSAVCDCVQELTRRTPTTQQENSRELGRVDIRTFREPSETDAYYTVQSV